MESIRSLILQSNGLPIVGGKLEVGVMQFLLRFGFTTGLEMIKVLNCQITTNKASHRCARKYAVPPWPRR